MIKNNIEVDVKVKCIESGMTQTQLAEKIKTTSPYVNRIIKKQDGVVNKTFVQMLEALGYDIELTYVKREEQEITIHRTAAEYLTYMAAVGDDAKAKDEQDYCRELWLFQNGFKLGTVYSHKRRRKQWQTNI